MDMYVDILIQEGEFMYYDPALGVLQDYTKGFIQFGFLTLFVAACPLVREAVISLALYQYLSGLFSFFRRRRPLWRTSAYGLTCGPMPGSSYT
jgi:hypothetical protein